MRVENEGWKMSDESDTLFAVTEPFPSMAAYERFEDLPALREVARLPEMVLDPLEGTPSPLTPESCSQPAHRLGRGRGNVPRGGKRRMPAELHQGAKLRGKRATSGLIS
jgi:hypothetical protein